MLKPRVIAGSSQNLMLWGTTTRPRELCLRPLVAAPKDWRIRHQVRNDDLSSRSRRRWNSRAKRTECKFDVEGQRENPLGEAHLWQGHGVGARPFSHAQTGALFASAGALAGFVWRPVRRVALRPDLDLLRECSSGG